jgi:hypothetical protein
MLGQFEGERNSRVIAMIHRDESASLLGDLYPQGGGIKPSVWYVPLHRAAAPGDLPPQASKGQP